MIGTINMAGNKYGNKTTLMYGMSFDSKRESERYLVLRDKLNKGEIAELQLQPVFELQPAFTDGMGKKHRPITYVADFTYHDLKNKVWVVEDAKGFKTEKYMIKKKLFLFKYTLYNFYEV